MVGDYRFPAYHSRERRSASLFQGSTLAEPPLTPRTGWRAVILSTPLSRSISRSVLAWLVTMLSVTAALTAASARATTPRYAAFMVDANTREVLYANAADELHHPASLTKMMTLYLTFDALESGRTKITDPVTVSRHAAAQKPSRLGLAVGQSISVDNAISVVAVKSANDIAVALAEKLGGSETAFVDQMNAKARLLGMRNTHFANASGLTDPTNITTARDLAILSVALVHDHPRFYRYFGERDFVWQRSTLINHNHLLGKMVGLDGIKTGYTVDSGFTLAASALRGNRRLIAVVLGEPSIAERNRDAAALLEAGFSVLDRRGVGQAATVASMLPTLDHPALRIEPTTAEGAAGDGDRPASHRRTRVHGQMLAAGSVSQRTHATRRKSAHRHHY